MQKKEETQRFQKVRCLFLIFLDQWISDFEGMYALMPIIL
jgi:hypothetical protein